MRIPPLAAALVGCAPLGSPGDVPIEAAYLADLDSNGATAVVGFVEGDALLVWDGPDGGGALPVHVGGPRLGAVVDVAFDTSPRADVPIDLGDVDDPHLDDVLGTYRGGSLTLAAGVGAHQRRLRHRSGAVLEDESVVVGVGVFGGVEWVRIRAGGRDTEDDVGGLERRGGGCGHHVVDGAPIDTGGASGDTARDDSGVDDSGVDDSDSSARDSGGAGGPDTDAGSGDTHERDGGDATSAPSRGCGCGAEQGGGDASTGGSCNCSGGTCATRPAPAGWVASLCIVAWVRRGTRRWPTAATARHGAKGSPLVGRST